MFKTNHDINTETKTQKDMGILRLTAKAEEGTQTQVTQPTPNENQQKSINFEDLVTKARNEEKSKLYPKIQKLEGERDALIEKNNKLLLDLGSKDVRISELTHEVEQLSASKNVSEDKKVKKLEDKIAELEASLAEKNAKGVEVEALKESLKNEYEVKLHLEKRLREVGDEIIPELVSGDTIEAIDESIVKAQERFKELASKFSTKEERQTLPSNNIDSSKLNLKDMSAEDIARLTPKEWAERRSLLGFK